MEHLRNTHDGGEVLGAILHSNESLDAIPGMKGEFLDGFKQ